YENVENSENERGEYAYLDKGVSSDADAGESSGEETVESRLHTVEMESTKLKEEVAYLRKENDGPHEKALNVPQVKQELSYAADDLHTMSLDEDAKVCIDEPKPLITLHSFIPADGVKFMALDEDAKYLPFFTTILNTPKDMRVDYINEEVRNRSHNKEPLSKQHYVPFRMHTHSRDYQPLDKQPEDKLVQVNAKVDSLLTSRDTAVVDENADKQAVDAKTIKMIKLKRKRRKKRKIGVISLAVIGDDYGEISLTDVTEQQPDTTKLPLVKRHSNRINETFNQAVIGDDCEKIPLTSWTEIEEFLRSDGNQKFSFPWAEKNFEVDKQFWSRLLGLHPHRNGWLMDWHLDLWIRYMWKTRPDSAN
ncbi:hypothetical protein Tco_0960704, partial [Tanacetum coccineum]